tara:strand:- start:436 stop:705 length:270 start_codon:yes stop_codon:yes gene_type:complete
VRAFVYLSLFLIRLFQLNTDTNTYVTSTHTHEGEAVHIPMNHMLPMVSPNDIVFGGWDISSANLADSMKRGKVIDYNLQVRVPFSNFNL